MSQREVSRGKGQRRKIVLSTSLHRPHCGSAPHRTPSRWGPDQQRRSEPVGEAHPVWGGHWLRPCPSRTRSRTGPACALAAPARSAPGFAAPRSPDRTVPPVFGFRRGLAFARGSSLQIVWVVPSALRIVAQGTAERRPGGNTRDGSSIGGRVDEIEEDIEEDSTAATGGGGTGVSPDATGSAAGFPGRSFLDAALASARGDTLRTVGGTSESWSFGRQSRSSRRSQHKRSPSSQARSALMVPTPLFVTSVIAASPAATGGTSESRTRSMRSGGTALCRCIRPSAPRPARVRPCGVKPAGCRRGSTVWHDPGLVKAGGAPALNRRARPGGSPVRRRCAPDGSG